MKQTAQLVWQHKWLSLDVLAALAGLILWFGGHHTLANWVLGVIALTNLVPAGWDDWQEIRVGRYGINLVGPLALVVAVLVREDWTAIALAVLLLGMKVVAGKAQQAARRGSAQWAADSNGPVHVVRKGKIVSATAHELKAGDKIVIEPNEVVPVDATVLNGKAIVDESLFTGNAEPQSYRAGDVIVAGSLNTGEVINARVLHPASDSQRHHVARWLRSAGTTQAPFRQVSERLNIAFSLVVVVVGIVLWLVSGHALRLLDILVAAAPYPIFLSVPLALSGGTAGAGLQGIIIKTGTALERLTDTLTIAFAKTSTLTSGMPAVAGVTAYGSFTKNQVLALAASVEQSSSHTLARAIVNEASQRGIKLDKVKHISEIDGYGVQARLKNQEVLVGRLSLLQTHAVELPPDFKPSSIKQTAVYIALGSNLAGVISFDDEVHSTAKAALARLRKLRIRRTALLTGDSIQAATKLARQLGINDVYAETLPGEKLHTLEHLEHRPVVFVSGTSRDIPAFGAADVSVALGALHNRELSESANVLVMQPDVMQLATLLEIAKRTFAIIQHAIFGSVLLSLLLIVVFATGKLPSLIGVALQAVIDLGGVFIALRARRVRKAA